ncbi:hypothetical protein DIE01_16205 [Burkholderia sp. Bp8990]|nr:hypothetical protein DIE01_16205 [Burkholderia sp. Bp8990]
MTPRVSDNDVAALELAIDRANAIGIQKSASEAASRATDAVTKAADAKASPATVGTPIAWQLVNPDTTARGTQQLDAAASAAAIGVDIDKPHKAAQDVKREQMQEQAQQRNEMLRKRLADVAELQNTPSAAAPAAHDSQASAPAEHGIADKPGLGKPETASAGVGDLIELTAPIAGYHGGAWLEVLARINENTVKALGPCGDDQPIFVLDSAYKVVQRAEDMSARARMAVRQFNQSMQSDHMADAIVSGLGIQRVWMDDDLVKRGTIPPAEWLRPDLSHLTQEQIDERTTKPDPIVCGSDYTVFMAGRQVGKTFALKHSHYFKPCPFDHIDVYRVLERFNVADPCLQHAIKKLLVAGGRGAKDIGQDVQEAIDTLERFKAMRKEEAA